MKLEKGLVKIMAYNAKDEVNEVIYEGEKNASGYYVRVSKITKGEKVSIDIRNVTNQPDGTVVFTSKGIRVDIDTAKEVFEALSKVFED